MLFISVIAALCAAVLIQYFVYKKYGLSSLEYNATFSVPEVYTGDDLYLYEEISNTGRLPLPFIKIDTDLPEGLVFTLLDSDLPSDRPTPPRRRRKGGPDISASLAGKGNSASSAPGATYDKRRMRRTRSIQSLFVLRPRARIRRRWRVNCQKRGEYKLGGVVVTANDLLGMAPRSARLELPERGRDTVVVLPQPERLDEHYSSSRYLCGDVISALCPVTDPIRICGSREYTPIDPMNRINWKSTASHGRLMVNVEEKTVRHRFSLLLNMNSREIEQRPDTPSDTSAIERCNVICASILDRIAAEDVPVSLFLNYPPSDIIDARAVSGEGAGANIAVCGPYRGRRDMIYALRMLAKLQMKISLPAEKMFDHIVSDPSLYSGAENLIVVSSYLDGRMMNMYKVLQKSGINVIFYIATSRNNVGVIPDGADVYFSL